MSTLEATPVQEWRAKDLEAYVGKLSAPSKMPGHAYSLPAWECITGSKLQQVPGSVCFDCYALKGRNRFPVVKDAQYRRLASLERPLWVDCMAELIRRKGDSHHRWHDAGDLQSLEHLRRIVEVCEQTPEVWHWLPTREYRLVTDYEDRYGPFPANLNVRASAHMVDGPAPTFRKHPDLTVSTVSTGPAPAGAHRCPASQQGNSCGDCRACWQRSVRHVDYPKH